MKTRWAPAFTIVEIIIVITAIAILATIAVLGYSNVRRGAMTAALKSDLDHVATEMQHGYQKDGSYPAALPTDFETSDNIALTVKQSGGAGGYSGLSEVQNGVLFATNCQDLVNEGVGKGVNGGGVTQNYIIGCGNWNHDWMQINAWHPKQWYTPVTKTQLLDYANTFTTSDTWNKAEETVVKNFYTQLVARQTQKGGRFPITTFWDSWATPTNGGVMQESLSTPHSTPYYCVEGTVTTMPDIIWHVTEEPKISNGPC